VVGSQLSLMMVDDDEKLGASVGGNKNPPSPPDAKNEEDSPSAATTGKKKVFAETMPNDVLRNILTFVNHRPTWNALAMASKEIRETTKDFASPLPEVTQLPDWNHLLVLSSNSRFLICSLQERNTNSWGIIA
jgi:hypothetical protein